jgi:hypothetical protein
MQTLPELAVQAKVPEKFSRKFVIYVKSLFSMYFRLHFANLYALVPFF